MASAGAPYEGAWITYAPLLLTPEPRFTMLPTTGRNCLHHSGGAHVNQRFRKVVWAHTAFCAGQQTALRRTITI